MAKMRYCSFCGDRIRFGFNENENEYVAWYDSESEGAIKRIFVCSQCVLRLANRFKEANKKSLEEEYVNGKMYCNACGDCLNKGDCGIVGKVFEDRVNKGKTIYLCKKCVEKMANSMREEKTSVVMVRKKLPSITKAIQVTESNLGEVAIFIQPSRFSILPGAWTKKDNWIVKWESKIICCTPKEFEERFEVIGEC